MLCVHRSRFDCPTPYMVWSTNAHHLLFEPYSLGCQPQGHPDEKASMEVKARARGSTTDERYGTRGDCPTHYITSTSKARPARIEICSLARQPQGHPSHADRVGALQPLLSYESGQCQFKATGRLSTADRSVGLRVRVSSKDTRKGES